MTQGKFDTLHTWLVENVYQHGSKFTANELVQKVTGGPLSIEPYLLYLKTKFGELYQAVDSSRLVLITYSVNPSLTGIHTCEAYYFSSHAPGDQSQNQYARPCHFPQRSNVSNTCLGVIFSPLKNSLETIFNAHESTGT